jgi:uncharacterized protein YjiS (DUF1127 family)
MAFATQTRTAGFDFSGLTAPFKALSEKFARYTVYRETLSELSQLSTRELNDLGLSHTGIRRIALEAAYGKNV